MLAGAVIGRVMSRHPVSAFAAGVVSHFVMDACPHWGTGGRDMSDEFLRVARCDGCAGLAAMALAAGVSPRRSRLAVVSAMAGSALPDVDKVFGHFLGWQPFPEWWQQLHKRVQNESPDRMHLEILAATALAALVLVVVGPGRSAD